MILIHTALQCEAQCIIEKYKLKKTNSNPKIYSNEKLVVLIGGIGKENTLKNLNFIFNTYSISKAINLGIVGCSDINVPIGAIFSCFNHLTDIAYKPLKTVNQPQTTNNEENMLYDMEASYFLEIVQKHLQNKDIQILKIVSDHLKTTILKKDQVKQLIHNNLQLLTQYIPL
jgi:hypothetical protein